MPVPDRRPLLAGAAAVLLAAGLAVPLAANAGENLATNPVLATDATGWGVLSGGTGQRVAVTGHPTATYGYQVRLSSADAGIYLPQLPVTGGKSYTIAVDTKLTGKARVEMDWYGSGGRYLGSSHGTAVTGSASDWKTVQATLVAPAGATNSHPLETVTGASGNWQSTAASYQGEVVTPPTTPPAGDGDTAAGNFHWGQPLPASDEFNYTGLPDSQKWGIYGHGGDDNCWPGHAGNGRRCVDANYVNGSFLRQTGKANGDSAGLASNLGQKLGRWEVRARVQAASGASGHAYHPVLITWPDSDEWPQGGEYDYFEVNVGDQRATAFLHHPTDSGVVQDEYHSGDLDLSQWHNYGFEWAQSGLTGYIDGKVWFHDTDPDVQAPGPMHQTIQLDNFFGAGGMQEAYFDVDWARVYALT
ncbi:glycoside hydrolase family 16 protein [Fodinicola acaciae]|uniref:glycoside hydrolase family 16 protein n=1 Tax=Fodinicola acaciae TaxID=2681555 RepID=UPI0013CFB553|nr:glycoside hydrolase family 16 protein [Fodinicola acaciae]